MIEGKSWQHLSLSLSLSLSRTHTHLVTMARFGAVRLAPMNSARFSCLVFFKMATSSLNRFIWSGLASGIENRLMATSPCQFPR